VGALYVTASQDQRRITFDEDALLYDQARPGYPDALFEEVIAFARPPAHGRILEIGCGTGQATLTLARRGYHIDCIELGANLAAVARRNLASYINVEITVGAFEAAPLQDDAYDLVTSASAFHWVDPAVRYRKAAQALKPNGSIALFWNKHVVTAVSADFFHAVQAIYERCAPDMAAAFPGLPHPDTLPTPVKAEIDSSDYFGEVTICKYPWNKDYDSTNYISLLDTYSDHRSLDNEVRERLFQGIAELIDTRFGGQITREQLAVLYLAHRNT
jgi:SAM-dependent methyltransferase